VKVHAVIPGRHTHVPVPSQYWRSVHAVVQVPQWLASSERSRHVPPPPPVQSVLPVGQLHALAVHVPKRPQVVPHAPQFMGSVLVSTHTPPHVVDPAEQTQTPLVHASPLAHVRPHAPQLFRSDETSAHPVAHATSPAGQMHAPPAHVAPGPQLCPHVPQCAGVVVKSTHSPGAGPQRVVPVGHAPQTPLVHGAPVGQTMPQLPQCRGSLDGSTHVPPHVIFGEVHGAVSTGASTVVSAGGVSPTVVSVGASAGESAFVSAGASPGLVSVVPSGFDVSPPVSVVVLSTPDPVSTGTLLS
jgi:hypothetical protein